MLKNLLQIEKVFEAGKDVFVDEERFLRWLRQPCDALGGKKPIFLLNSVEGVKQVRDELVRIDYGIPI